MTSAVVQEPASSQSIRDMPQPTTMSSDVARTVTVAACAAALIIALLPAFLPGHGRVPYDPILAIYTVTFMGVAWYTFFQRQTLRSQQIALTYAHDHDLAVRQQAIEDHQADFERQRRSLATALLAELRPLTARLGTVCEQGPASYHDPFPHPVIVHALSRVELFAPVTVQRLARMAGMLSDVRALIPAYREARQKELDAVYHLELETVTKTNQNEVKVARSALTEARDNVQNIRLMVQGQAYWAFENVGDLASALVNEGGLVPPTAKGTEITGPNLPPLPPNPFDSLT